jgi:NTP pyrophosphatase (non-canonical NTP hydrolase)
MTPKDYVKNALRTEPTNYEPVLTRAGQEGSLRLLHAFLGICTEAGEINDALKKALIYGKPFDKVNAIEELGDLMWYIAIASDTLEVSLEDIMEKNIAKLKARYGEKFTEEAALNRDLDKEINVLINSGANARSEQME